MTSRRGLAIICAVYAALAVAYSLATDLKGGPDETAHFIYIRSLATRHALPEVATVAGNSVESDASHEGHQPPLYYAVMSVPYAVMDRFGASTDTIWRVLRILGIIFGVAWICSAYPLARSVLGTERRGLAAAGFVALIPTAAYMAGVLNNDIMISMWFGWAMVLMVRFLREGDLDRRSAVALGLLIGAAILTKAQGLLLVPIFVLEAVAVWLMGQPRKPGQTARVAGTVLLAAVVVCGWWLTRSLLLYGTLQPQSLYHPALANGFAEAWRNWPEFVRVARIVCVGTYGYFWTPFWLIQPFVDGGLYTSLVLLLSALPVVGLLMRTLFIRDVDARVLGFLLATAVIVFLSWFRYVMVIDCGANLQGRLFLPVASVVGIVAVAGVQPWLGKRGLRLVAACVIYGGMVAANLLILRCVLAYYALGYGG